jgi:AbrB family looped-hinge helix DNA binding protein
MLSVKVSTKHQISVPSAARRALGIKAGDRLTVEVREGEIALKPRTGSAVDRLRGSGRGTYGDPVAYVRALRDEWED